MTCSRYARNLFGSKIKRSFEIMWALFEMILFIHFYPPKLADGRSQRHFMKNLHKILLFTTSNEYILTIFYFHTWVEKCHFCNFSERLIRHFLTHAWKSKEFWSKCMYSFEVVNNSLFWKFFHEVILALSMCLFMWIKVDK